MKLIFSLMSLLLLNNLYASEVEINGACADFLAVNYTKVFKDNKTELLNLNALEKGFIKPTLSSKNLVSFDETTQPKSFSLYNQDKNLLNFKVFKSSTRATKIIINEVESSSGRIDTQTLNFKFQDNGECIITSTSFKSSTTPLMETYSLQKCLDFEKIISKGHSNKDLWRNYSSSERTSLAKKMTNDSTSQTKLANNTHLLSKSLFTRLIEVCPNHTHPFNEKYLDYKLGKKTSKDVEKIKAIKN